jgi:hypothetical protein
MIDRWIDAIIADWPLYLVATVVWVLSLLAVRVGFHAVAAECEAWRQARAANREAKAIEAGRRLYEQAARNRTD